MDIDEKTKKKILDFVDEAILATEEVWLTGSRSNGTSKVGSDWDVIVISEHCPRKYEDVFKTATQNSKFNIDGGHVEAVCVHPDVLALDSRPYFADCRKFGIRLR